MRRRASGGRRGRHVHGDPADDDYAHFVGPQVPQVGEGWLHYDVAVPSADMSAVPAGWSGGAGGVGCP